MNVCMSLKRPKCERIGISEKIEINKSNKSNKFESYIFNKCHDTSMMACESENNAILNVKGINYWLFLWNMTKNDAINRLNNSKLDDKSTS